MPFDCITSSCQQFRAVLRNYRSKPPVDAADADRQYLAYQSWLSNVMVVSTLLLGFILTGTMMNVSLTGDENFTGTQLYVFLWWSVLAGSFALFTTILVFLTMGRATDFYTRYGPFQGLRIMHRSLCSFMIAEFLLYSSLLCFGWSITHYVSLSYVGPKICPKGFDGTTNGYKLVEGFSHSVCAALGNDFYDTVHKYCSEVLTVDTSIVPVLCEEKIRDVGEGFKFVSKHNFIWDTESLNEFQKLADLASKQFCDTSAATERKVASCAGLLDTPEKRMDCSSASAVWHQANTCADGKIVDAVKCRNVCGKHQERVAVHDMPSASWYSETLASAVIISFAAFRLISSFLKAAAFVDQEITSYGCWRALFNQVDVTNARDLSIEDHTKSREVAAESGA